MLAHCSAEIDVLMMRQTSLKAMTMVKWFQRFGLQLKTANAQKVPEGCATNKRGFTRHGAQERMKR